MKKYLTAVSLVMPLFIVIIFLSGCVTSSRNILFLEADKAFEAGDYDIALKIVDANKETLYRNRDMVLYHLEKGMLNFYLGNPEECIRHLDEAELLIEENFTKSIRQAAGSLLINDLQMDYSGEDFEDIYLNVFKAISYLQLGDTDAAFVEVRRISNKLNLLEDKYQRLAQELSRSDDVQGVQFQPGSNRFYNSALARYLSLLMYRSEGNYDGVRIDWDRLQEAFARQENLYQFPIPFDSSIARPSDDSRLSVMAFTGRSPIKLSSTLWVNTYENWVLIAAASEYDRIGRVLESFLSFEFPGVKEGYRFKFEIPRMEPRGSEIERIRVIANGRVLGELGLLEDIQQVTLDTFEVREPMILLRSVTRTIIKGIAAETAGSAMDKAGAESGSLLLQILGFIGDKTLRVTAELTEQADLRVSRYFPAFTYAGEWELPEGEYHVKVEYYGRRGLLFVEDLGSTTVRPNRPNLLTSAFSR